MADGRVVCVGVLFLLLFHFLVGNIDINTPKPWTKKDFNILHQNIRGLFGKKDCLLYTSPSPRDKRQSRMPSSA